MGRLVKTEYARHPTQDQDGIHPAMKKLYNHAKGARTFECEEDLTIDRKYEDPADSEAKDGALQEGEAPAEGPSRHVD